MIRIVIASIVMGFILVACSLKDVEVKREEPNMSSPPVSRKIEKESPLGSNQIPSEYIQIPTGGNEIKFDGAKLEIFYRVVQTSLMDKTEGNEISDVSQIKDYNVYIKEDKNYFFVDFDKKVDAPDGIGLVYAIKKQNMRIIRVLGK